MTTPLDLAWARRCAAGFDAKPTEARARNAAQCLTGLLDAYDAIVERAAQLAAQVPAHLLLPPELCKASLPDAEEGDHDNDPRHAYRQLQAGVDPCPARSWDQKTCLKGYLHTGGHEWGTTQAIEAGPQLPNPCHATQDGPNGERLICFLATQHHGDHSTGGWPHHTTWPKEPELCGYPGCENPENGMGHFHATDRSGQI